jgi:hypothetical protein
VVEKIKGDLVLVVEKIKGDLVLNEGSVEKSLLEQNLARLADCFKALRGCVKAKNIGVGCDVRHTMCYARNTK